MKFRLLILLCSNILFFHNAIGQKAENITFTYRCVPTNTLDYAIQITRNKFDLNIIEKIPNKNNRIVKVDSSHYTFIFDTRKKEILDSIIKINKLDSAGLYHDRITEWGTLWEVEIEKNSITTDIKLPNYNNPGLAALLHFIVCLIPRKELPVFLCKECN